MNDNYKSQQNPTQKEMRSFGLTVNELNQTLRIFGMSVVFLMSFFGVNNAHAYGAYANTMLTFENTAESFPVGVAAGDYGNTAAEVEAEARAICETRKTVATSEGSAFETEITSAPDCEVIKTFVGCLAVSRINDYNSIVFFGVATTPEEAQDIALMTCVESPVRESDKACAVGSASLLNHGSDSPSYACSLCPSYLEYNSDFTECVCPSGTMPVGSRNNITSCAQCPPGQISEGISACMQCTGNEIVNSSRSACEPCQPRAVPNDNHTACMECPTILVAGSDGSACLYNTP